MHEIWSSLQHFLDAEVMLREGGFYILLFVVFAETGLFFGFFLPGDYLLFLSGMFVATHQLDVEIVSLIGGLVGAAVLGNFIGYGFGWKTGPLLYEREDSIFFKRQYLKSAEQYYKKQGVFALVMGRFIPVVRTFAPIIAGIVKLDIKKFAFYNLAGAILWVSSLTLLGYFLGKRFEEQIEHYLLYIIFGFIIITSLPLVWTFLKTRLKSNRHKK